MAERNDLISAGKKIYKKAKQTLLPDYPSMTTHSMARDKMNLPEEVRKLKKIQPMKSKTQVSIGREKKGWATVDSHGKVSRKDIY